MAEAADGGAVAGGQGVSDLAVNIAVAPSLTRMRCASRWFILVAIDAGCLLIGASAFRWAEQG